MRKGELSRRRIDQQWPYHVALPEAKCTGGQWVAHNDFNQGRSLAPRGYSFFRDDVWWRVFCFAAEADADAFAEEFTAEMIDPNSRPKWPR